MIIPQISFTEYIQCFNCIKECGKVYYSHSCLHPLCDNCYKYFLSQNVQIKCKKCNLEWTLNDSLSRPNYEIYFENESEIRKKLFDRYYKRRENFNSDDEYNNYLENFEDIIRLAIERKNYMIEDNIQINKKENETNLKYFIEMKRNLEKKLIDNDPNKLYNPLFKGNLVNDLMDIEDDSILMNNARNINNNKFKLPEYIEGAKIKIIKSKEKEIIAGGYDSNAVFCSYNNYAKAGII